MPFSPDKLLQYRRERGMSQESLAAACGVCYGTIAHFERGRRRPSIRLMLKLATVLGVTIRDLYEAKRYDGPEEKKEEKKPQPAIDPNLEVRFNAINRLT